MGVPRSNECITAIGKSLGGLENALTIPEALSPIEHSHTQPLPPELGRPETAIIMPDVYRETHIKTCISLCNGLGTVQPTDGQVCSGLITAISTQQSLGHVSISRLQSLFVS